MIPLVDGVVDVQAFIALKVDQLSIQRGGQGPGDLCFADTGFTL